jgi:glycine cleavage system regulatory protein
MTSLAITLIGPDRTGIIEDVADIANQHGANWLESQLANLAGQFAGIVHLQVAEANADALKTALEALAKNGLQVNALTTSSTAAATARVISLELLGQDHPGIVREIAAAMSRIGVSIAELETETLSASMSGETLFKANAKLVLPDGLSADELDKQLQSVSNEFMVDINLDEFDKA